VLILDVDSEIESGGLSWVRFWWSILGSIPGLYSGGRRWGWGDWRSILSVDYVG
jgi:hypothetical protein